MIASLKKNAPCLPAACLPAKAGQRQGKGRAKAGQRQARNGVTGLI